MKQKKEVVKKEKETWWKFLELDKKQSKPDVVLSLCLMLIYGCVCLRPPLKALWNLVHNYDKAPSLDHMVKTICGLSLKTFIIFTWFAKAFGGEKTEASIIRGTKSSFFHKLLSRGIMGQNFMPGGFAPRWFALSVGILLFVNKIFLTAVTIKGSTFNNPVPGDPALIHKWPGGIGCWANSDMPSDSSLWFARLWRKPPVGCYMASEDDSIMFYLKPNATIPNLANPFQEGTDTVDKTRTCMYQCVAWQSLAVQTILLSSGVIVAGGVFIERLTNAITTSCGYGFIDTNSDEEQLSKALDTLLKKPPIFLMGLKRTIFVVVLMSIETFVHAYSVLLDKDGSFTVDYYITSAFMLSVLLSLLFRNVETLSRVQPIYTRNLWSKGADLFQSRDAGKKLVVDLYEWSHISALSKAQLLLDYARTIELKDIHEFDLDEFTEQGLQRSKPAPGVPDGISQDPANSVRQRLLDVDSRLSSIERGPAPLPRRNTCADFDDEDGVVRCIKHFVSFTDVFIQVFDEGKWSWQPMRLQILVKPKASGKVLGTLMQGTVMVQWNNNEHIQHHGFGDSRIDNSPYVVSDIKLTHIVEHNKRWHELQERINAAEDLLKRQNDLIAV